MYIDTRERILRTAITLFAKHGFDNVPMREIAFDAGVTRSEMADYFKSKDILLGSILEYIPKVAEIYDPTRSEIVEQLEREGPRGVLYRFYTFYRWENDNLLAYIYRFVYMELYRKSAVSMFAYEHFIEKPIKTLEKALNTLVELSAIPPCDSEALAHLWQRTALIYGIQSLQSEESMRDRNEEYQDIYKFFIEVAVKGVAVIPVEQIEMKWNLEGLCEKLGESNHTEKGQIMLTALDLFCEHGYSKITVKKIAEAMNVPVDMIYSHYSSKGGIMKAIVDNLITAFTEFRFHNPVMQAAMEDFDQEKIILTLSIAYPPSREEEMLKLYRILMREQYFDEDLRDFFQASLLRDRRMVIDFLDEIVEAGYVRPCPSDKVAIAYVYSMFSLTFAATVFTKDYDNLRTRVTAILLSLVKNGYINE